ncbi:MAG: isochorismatase family protein [Alphaproteobacteria bacterium]|nr:isochorismatase family protein [Alphaproteobacteria bacterium]MBU2144983.1 isochorismatase family protein [Alphaproteobacteria bacterium]
MNDVVYQKQQFGQKVGLGRSPALLVVDFVNGFTDPEILGGGNIPDAVAATKPLLTFFREASLPVVFTRIVYADDGADTGIWCMKVPRLRDLTEKAHASQIVDALAPRAGELVIRKTQASAFFGTHLAAHFIGQGIDSIVLAGCTTSGCIRASAIDAMSMNYRVTVASDCVGDRAIGPHEANLFDMGQKYADLLGGADIVSALSRSRSGSSDAAGSTT